MEGRISRLHSLFYYVVNVYTRKFIFKSADLRKIKKKQEISTFKMSM